MIDEKGILYGVSTGTGDPMLMTLKAVQTVRDCEIIAVPYSRANERSVALDIVSGAVDVSDKEILYLEFPMSHDSEYIKRKHVESAEAVCGFLENGKNVAFLCLGDVSVYSTFSYVSDIVGNKGFRVSIIPGITSFCAIASEFGIDLVRGHEKLVVIPCPEESDISSESGITQILMKIHDVNKLKNRLTELENSGKRIYTVENVGMSDMKKYEGVSQIPDKCGYFTTVLIR